jgi:hypothetical protein
MLSSLFEFKKHASRWEASSGALNRTFTWNFQPTLQSRPWPVHRCSFRRRREAMTLASTKPVGPLPVHLFVTVGPLHSLLPPQVDLPVVVPPVSELVSGPTSFTGQGFPLSSRCALYSSQTRRAFPPNGKTLL